MSNKPHLSSKPPVEPADEPNIAPSGMGAPPVSHGHKIEPVLPDDDQNTEFLTRQALEDAEDDLRKEARHNQDKADR
jgi:hypothetical protein